MTSGRARGFTLIEALLALAIFGMIAVLAYRATSALSDGEARLSVEAQRWRTLEALFTRFESDIRQAVPRSVRVGASSEPAWVATASGNQSALVFTRAGGWRRNWPLLGEDDVPRGVRLTLTLADGARIDRWFALR